MIKKLFDRWKKTKEQKAVKLALKLREVLFDIGYEKPSKGTANLISIWEHDAGEIKIEERKSGIEINVSNP